MDPLELAEMEAELKSDLDALSRVRRMMESRKNRDKANNGLAKPIGPLVAIPVSTDAPEDDDYQDEENGPNVSLRGKIAQVVNEQPDVKWTTQKVLLHLQKTGFPLKAQKPRFSVGQALNKLTEQGKIRLTRKGTGSEPNIYRSLASTQTSARDTLFFESGNAQKEGDSKLN
jgi:hypothetical protein